MGAETMKPRIELDKTTNVAFFDVEEAAQDAVIRVESVSDVLGLKCEVLVRVDIKNKIVLGLVIEDFRAFKREVRMKYLAWRVEKLIDLLICRVKSGFNFESASNDGRLLTATR
jgi:hypothetical protein